MSDAEEQHTVRGGDPVGDPLADPLATAEIREAALDQPSTAREVRRRRLAQQLFGVEQEPVRLGRFVLLERLGEGAMGTVHLAYDPQLDRRVALKLLRPAQGTSSLLRTRMLREAQALARLSHPNVVPVHDAGIINDEVVIVMEYVRGQTLRLRVEEERPSWREVLSVYVQAGQGLAGAHTAGVIHRDFKPDNAIRGDDGRVRVLDFGLARGVERDKRKTIEVTVGVQDRGPLPQPDGSIATVPASGQGLGVRLTATGAVMGTPAYMAPEQFAGSRADARADQYSFCVALYEALYGEVPFTGDSLHERQQSVTEGLVRPAPEGTRVPAWIRAVLLRGLEREPDARYADMATLLAGLLDDPDRRRQRRRRLVAGIALVVVVTVALIFGGLESWARWREHRLQSTARERVEALDARLEALVAAGKSDDARRAFRLFVEQPHIRGTAAEGRAWLHQAVRERAADNERAAADAYGAAYTVATSTDDQVAALVGLATFLRDEYRWDQLGQAMATMEQRIPEAASDPAVQTLRFEAALGRRDLSAAVEVLENMGEGERRAHAEPIVRALSLATRTDLNSVHGTLRYSNVELDKSRSELVFVKGHTHGATLKVAKVSPELPIIDSIDVESEPVLMVARPGDDPVYLSERWRTTAEGREIEWTLLERDGDEMRELFTWPEHKFYSALSHDFDGDGKLNTYIGLGPYKRDMIELVHTGAKPEEWALHSPAPAIAQRNSDVVSLLAGDLDGDGVDELVAALGPWKAYEIHVLRYAPESNTFETVTRHKLGNIYDMLLIHREENAPPEIVAVKTDDYANTDVFPHESPMGEPAGTYFFRLQDGTLVQTAFIRSEEFLDNRIVTQRKTTAADLDGDGRQELIEAFSASVPAKNQDPVASTLIYWSDVHGQVQPPIALGGTRPLDVYDLDGDGDDELLVEFSDDPARQLWVLGSGVESAPVVAAQPLGVVGIEAPPNTALATMWRRASDLEVIGLRAQAAAGFATLADLSNAQVERAQARLVAARIHEDLGEDERATALYEESIDEPSLAVEATEGAVRGAVRRGDYAHALATIDRALSMGDALGGEGRERIAAQRERLARLVSGEETYELRFDRPLSAGWLVDRPLALRRDPETRSLRVDTTDPGPIATRTLNWSGGHLAVDADVELLGGEWNGDFQLVLVPTESPRPKKDIPFLGARFRLEGGGSDIKRHIMCHAGYEHNNGTTIEESREHDSSVRRFHIRASIDTANKEATCRITTVDGVVLHYNRQPILEYEVLEPQQLKLMFTSTKNTNHARLSTAVHGVTVYGATSVPEPAAAPRRADAALVEGEYVEALRALDELAASGEPQSTRTALWRVMALAEMHRVDDAAVVLEPLLTSNVSSATNTDENRRGVLQLLRLRPRLMAPVILKAAGPVRATEWTVEAWAEAFVSSAFNDEPMRVLRGTLAHIESLELSKRSRLDYLSLRARVYGRLGMDSHLRRDIETQLGLIADPSTEEIEGDAPDWRSDRRESLEFELAAAAARGGDLETARLIVERLTAHGQNALLYVDKVRAHPELAPLRSRIHDP